MATTANYGWSTPDDTSLVKDGASAIRTLGSSIDTTVFNNANAAIQKSIVDAKGDLIAATAADTVARLAVGANDTVLTADSTTATGLKWATVSGGGYTELATGTLSGTAVTISSISNTYRDLVLILRDVSESSGANVSMRINSDSSNNYYSTFTTISGADVTLPSSQFPINYYNGTATNYLSIVSFYDYANISTHKYVDIKMAGQSATDPLYSVRNARAIWGNATTAISALTIRVDGVATLSGTYVLYGVK